MKPVKYAVLYWPFNSIDLEEITTIYSDNEDDLNEVLDENDNGDFPGLKIPLTESQVKSLINKLEDWLKNSKEATKQQLADGGTFGI
jgi:hypothetical protein